MRLLRRWRRTLAVLAVLASGDLFYNRFNRQLSCNFEIHPMTSTRLWGDTGKRER